MGEEEEIELSVHCYKNGQPDPLPVVPRLIFTWKQEKDVWRLTEVTVAAHMPLTDPDYLAGLRKRQNESYEESAQSRVNLIAGAEAGYVAAHPNQGYTCALANLFANDSGPNQEQPTGYYDPGQGSNEWNGYRFEFSGCEGSPVVKYRITAVPVDPDSETKTFCADESGTVKSLADGKPSACFSRGQVLNTFSRPAATED
jgi:hypothetical protein